MKHIFFLLFISLFIVSFGQGTGWTLQSDKEGIKLYTKPTKADGTMQIRLVASTTAPIASVLKASQDVSNVKERIMNSKSLTILKQVSVNEAYYHLTSDFPWPLDDRDVVMHATVSQDPKTKAVKVDAYSVPSYIPEKTDHLRIYTWETHSISTPKADGTVEIDYWFNYNPRGNVPNSVIQAVTKDATINGMKKFIQLTHSSKYK